MPQILFLGGPSGSGKTTFASGFLKSQGWSHLEIDRFPEGDGIDLERLRTEWDAFWSRLDPAPLWTELSRRARGVSYLVVTFPGNCVFTERHLEISGGLFHIGYLFGDAAACLKAFTERETETRRGLPRTLWIQNNLPVYDSLARPENQSRLIQVFWSDGSRRPPVEILEDLRRLMGETG